MNTNVSFMNSDKLKLNDKKYVVFVDFLFVFVVAIEYLREIMKKNYFRSLPLLFPH